MAVLTLSATGLCTRTRKKTHRRHNVGEEDSLNQAQDETIDRNSTYANVVTVTNQDNMISDDQSLCDCNTEFSTQIDQITGKDSTEDNNEKGSDVVYAQVHKKPKAINVLPGDIYAQVICEATHIITNVETKWTGSVHNARIFRESSLCQTIQQRQYNGYLLGDRGYPCLPYLMTPYPEPDPGPQTRLNLAHSRRRAKVEMTIGILRYAICDKHEHRHRSCRCRGINNVI
ncbi:nuclease HARBI1 [Labeo rohita]|uniref:Nuclease HARBI1 n=1 Tax=Labeo rohita TaxID=84645 RepID=A0A498P3Q1_LABRO|nr:nuclease HARBI1 [Labeo rohita]